MAEKSLLMLFQTQLLLLLSYKIYSTIVQKSPVDFQLEVLFYIQKILNIYLMYTLLALRLILQANS